ncbi:T9SS type A sorting domain-containing protein [Dyadobacter arcticus]|uniref:T9SS type A sorting domain-containing protein n=1 Tax=Dyadobacter arcticus TaxID=1078754 RepID=A0ABX0UWZ1_9BACT|nr:T9SS type A sorting domain-containing protein [Dyadobacter arcticus]NIJ55461.1 hypothetical protein [Dyadobacter arcticus]
MMKFYTLLQIGSLILLHFLPAKAQRSTGLSKGVTETGSLLVVADRTEMRRGLGPGPGSGSARSFEPGYYRTNLVAGAGKRWMDQQKALRAMATEPCGDYLCKGEGGLPVTLISFSGSRQDTTTVLLNWETSEETNNQRFEVERSLDPQRGFEMAGVVDGAGNTGSKYHFQDLNRWAEVTYYRLRQVDYDGTSTYSRIISVKGARIALSILAYPNPGTPDKIRFQLEGSENAGRFSIQLTDVKGSVLYSDNVFKVEKARSFPLPKLPALTRGMYILRVSNGPETTTVPFIIY